VDAQVVAAGAFGEGVEFVEGIDGAEFGGLGEAEGAGFGVVEVAALGGEAGDFVGVDFAVRPGSEEDFAAAGEELGGAAFVAFDVGGFVAEDAVVALAE
jgi:hypothetical protein